MKESIKYLALIFLLFMFACPNTGTTQTLEPEVQKAVKNISDITNQYRSGFGFNVLMNNFGFGIGGEFRTVIAPKTELFATVRATGLRDASEQTFTDVFFGQQIIPNKYQRAFAFPLLLGMRHRLFSNVIQDDYRFFVTASMGPAMAFSYPYFEDANNNGYREQFQTYFEPINDIFSGMSNGDWHLGGTGEVKIGLDIGGNFARLNSIEFGYFFYYFPDGIQLMMPNQPDLRENIQPGQNPFQPNETGDGILLEPFFEAQSFFGSPQITFSFGWLW